MSHCIDIICLHRFVYLLNAQFIPVTYNTMGRSTDTTILPRLGNGKFEVGYAEIMVSDGENDDTGILLTIYYPADSTLTYEKSQHPLWLTRKEYIDGVAAYRNSSTLLLRFINKYIIGKRRIPARQHLALNNTVTSYPVLIFSHGLSGCRNFYSVYCSSVASHEIPVKIRKLMPTDDEFQLRNGQLHKRTAECIETVHLLEELNLGQLSSDQQTERKLLLGNDFCGHNSRFPYDYKSRLDTSRIFIAGHSFGGITAIAAAAVVVLDGWMFPIDKELLTHVRQPVLFMNAEHFQWEANIKDMLQIMEKSERSVLLTFNGTYGS
ncbi:Platelet-activating factor acetylhydrolase [Dirofilaria immitis]|nr:Platelet-activating factor acetylhydrolase [Dirofilaria immitis]